MPQILMDFLYLPSVIVGQLHWWFRLNLEDSIRQTSLIISSWTIPSSSTSPLERLVSSAVYRYLDLTCVLWSQSTDGVINYAGVFWNFSDPYVALACVLHNVM